MSNTRATTIPNIPSVRKDGGEGTFFTAVKEALDVGLRRRGDPLDAFVRYRDLRDGGIASVSFAGSTTGSINAGGDGNGGIFLTPTPPGTNPPPSGHLNVRTRSVWDGIMIQWDWPPGNIEYAYTEIWAAKLITPPGTVPAFTQATLVGSAQGNLFVHTGLGLGVTWYYWLRYVGFAPPNNPSGAPPMSLFTPSQAGPGVRGVTAADPTYVLAVLAGGISEAQLALGLGERIDLVDYYINEFGVRVPVPRVAILDTSGNPTGLTTQAVHNRILIAIRDASIDYQAAISQEASIRLRDDNRIVGAYSVKIDLNGFITGFGLVAERQVGGDLSTDTPTSTFIVRANKFAFVFPDMPNAPTPNTPVYPFIIGLVDNIPTVGINGQLVVDGTITARHIQAQTIGANEINAQSVWAGVVSAPRAFFSVMKTSDDTNWRIEIEGNNATYPFWYGQGEKGGDNSVFFFDRNGNTWLAGNLNVTGAGRFSTSAGSTSARVEIGGNDGLLMWAGSGVRNTQNAKFYFSNAGDLVIRGNPVTFPYGAGSGNSVPTGTIRVVAVEGMGSVPVLIMARTTIQSSSGVERTVTTSIKVDGVIKAQFNTSVNMQTFSETQFAIVDLPNITQNRTIEMVVEFTAVAGGNTMPTFNYSDSNIFGLQLAASL